MKNVILSLYDYSGNWSQPYLENGFDVIQVDLLKNNTDVRLMKYVSSRNVFGILAATPCTYFSQARKIPDDKMLIEGLSCADAVFRMVTIYKPVFWCIENPAKSRLWRYIGKPKQIINYNWFGYESKKPTGLYGSFNNVIANNKKCNINTIDFAYGNRSDRSTTPVEFAKSFYDSNNILSYGLL